MHISNTSMDDGNKIQSYDVVMWLKTFSVLYTPFYVLFLGGGVMGAPGWNGALTVLADLKHQ